VTALVVDSTDSFSIEEQAEGFRIQVGMWKDNWCRARSKPIASVGQRKTASSNK
jgi:hypothetical protein